MIALSLIESKILNNLNSPLRIVLDTNVVMALWVFEDPNLQSLRARIVSQQIHLLTRNDCLEELQRVLNYSQFKLSSERQTQCFADYAKWIELISAEIVTERQIEQLPRCKDRDDQKFLELAWLARADYLLTRDKALLSLARRPLLRDVLKIMTPERFIAMAGNMPAIVHHE